MAWPGARGGVQRSGWQARFSPLEGVRNLRFEDVLKLQLPDACRSLLVYDGFLIAASQSGNIQIVGLSGQRRERATEFAVGGPLFAEPAVSQGVLYVATEKALTAYDLGGRAGERLAVAKRWQQPLPAPPLNALLPLDARLYVVMEFNGRGHREIHAVDGLAGRAPRPLRRLHAHPRMSTLAANPVTRIALALEEDDDGVAAVLWEQRARNAAQMQRRPISGAPRDLQIRQPIGLVGARVFAAFGQSADLTALDSHDAAVDTKVCKGARSFALAGPRDAVVVTAGGVFFSRLGVTEALAGGEAAQGAPVVLRDRVAAVGLRDGRVRLYDLRNPVDAVDWRFADPSHGVNVMAAFGDRLLVGDDKGLVKVAQLRQDADSSSSGA